MATQNLRSNNKYAVSMCSAPALAKSAQRLALCPFGVLVRGTRQHHFDGTSLKPRKVPENAYAAPTDSSLTCRVHVANAGQSPQGAVLGTVLS